VEPGRIQEELYLRPRASQCWWRRRFAPADPELLDQEGLDLILIAAAEDAEDDYLAGTKASAAEFMQ
jgi:hypothetical protein